MRLGGGRRTDVDNEDNGKSNRSELLIDQPDRKCVSKCEINHSTLNQTEPRWGIPV